MGPLRSNTAIINILGSAWRLEFSIRSRYRQAEECSDAIAGLFYLNVQLGPLVILCCILTISTESGSGTNLRSGLCRIFYSISHIHNKHLYGQVSLIPFLFVGTRCCKK